MDNKKIYEGILLEDPLPLPKFQCLLKLKTIDTEKEFTVKSARLSEVCLKYLHKGSRILLSDPVIDINFISNN